MQPPSFGRSWGAKVYMVRLQQKDQNRERLTLLDVSKPIQEINANGAWISRVACFESQIARF